MEFCAGSTLQASEQEFVLIVGAKVLHQHDLWFRPIKPRSQGQEEGLRVIGRFLFFAEKEIPRDKKSGKAFSW